MKLSHLFRFLFKTKRGLLLLAALIIIPLVGFMLSKGNKGPELTFATAKREDIKSTISASGTLTGKEVSNLRFLGGGRLAYLNVNVNDTVTKGHAIAGLNTQDLAITLQQAQNDLRAKQATAEKVLDDVKDSDKSETYTQKQTRTAAEAARDSAYDAVKQAQRAFSDTVVTAPIAGIITQTNVLPGQFVNGSDVVAQIVDTSEIYFESEVDEADIGQVKIGQSAEVTLDANPDNALTGTVAEISPSIKTTSNGATVIIVKINLGKPNLVFVNGLSGQAEITVNQSNNALAIPQEAVVDDNSVLVKRGEKIEKVQVELGLYSETMVEIKSGLNEGDEVVTNPSAYKAK